MSFKNYCVYRLRSSREGVDLSTEELQTLLSSLTPRQKQQNRESLWAEKTKSEHLKKYKDDKKARVEQAQKQVPTIIHQTSVIVYFIQVYQTIVKYKQLLNISVKIFS